MFRLTRCSLSAVILAGLLTSLTAHPQPASAPNLDQILSRHSRARATAQVAVSPDGKHVAWLEAAQLRVAPLDHFEQSRPITAAAPGQSCGSSEFAWSPDSTLIAFLSDCSDSAQLNLFLAHFDGGPAIRLSELHGYADGPAFSPDGRTIAFLYVAGATRPPGALSAETPPSGVIGEDHIEVQRVAAVSAGASQPVAPVFLTPPNLHVFEFDWSPDSKSLAYIAADPPGENNWWVAKLYTQSVSVGLTSGAGAPSNARAEQNEDDGVGMNGVHSGEQGTPTPILAPAEIAGPLHGLQIAQPRWSPDGKSIAFIGGLMSDQGVVGGDVWITSDVDGSFSCGQLSSTGQPPPECGQPVNLTPNRPASTEWFTWEGSDAFYVSELSGGESRLVRLDRHPAPSTLSSPSIFGGFGTFTSGGFTPGYSMSADRSIFVFQSSSFNTPPEIFELRLKDPTSPGTSRLKQLSHFNDGVKPSWGDAVSLSWKNDGFNIQGWLLLPEHYDPSKKYPLLVAVHGGPASSVASRWDGGAGGFSSTVFSSLGYFVLMPNPRGSYGQGEAFTQANRKDFGYGDLRDILAGVDTVLARYPVDPNRVGIAGWSYGGFMSMFAITQTHRFHAAIAGAGISDWLSYYGENSIDQWMIPYFGASVYDDPQVYARSSAIGFVKNASTPTLIVVGDRDGECPAPQSFEFWHALRDLHVPVQFVVYPNEGHGFSDPADRRDSLERAVNWLARCLPSTP